MFFSYITFAVIIFFTGNAKFFPLWFLVGTRIAFFLAFSRAEVRQYLGSSEWTTCVKIPRTLSAIIISSPLLYLLTCIKVAQFKHYIAFQECKVGIWISLRIIIATVMKLCKCIKLLQHCKICVPESRFNELENLSMIWNTLNNFIKFYEFEEEFVIT